MILTRREMQIAELVAEGLTSKEVANRLGISRKSVDAQLHTILLVLHIGSRKQVAEHLAQFKQDHGLRSASPSAVNSN
jgi:non-specific serine/threonine protein kinase